nr:hypothetical protein GCM10020092_068290 [Actinoplanes digitatis]
MPDRGLGLYGDELDEVVDLEDGAGGILDLPDDDGGDLDGVAVGVVDLEHVGLVVADAGGDPAPGGERVDPAESVRADGPGVAAEELNHAGLAGRDRGEAGEGDQSGQSEHGAEADEAPDGRGVLLLRANDAGDAAEDDRQDTHGEDRPARGSPGDALAYLRCRQIEVFSQRGAPSR